MRILAFIIFFTLISTAAYAYYDPGWNIISTVWGALPFWTSNNPQEYGYLGSGEQHTFSWQVNASGARGLYEAVITYNSTSPGVNSNSSFFNIIIYDKGDNGVIPNESCTGCAFVLNGSNPFHHGNLTEDEIRSVMWKVNASGPSGSEWDVFVDYMYGEYGEQSNSTTNDRPLKVRIVDYKWRDESGYINESWNCRKVIEVTNETDGGIGRIRIADFDPHELAGEDACRTINCTKNVRVSEISNDGTHTHIPYISAFNEELNPDYPIPGTVQFCDKVDIEFNSTLIAGETKRFFIYYDNPIIEDDYMIPSGPLIFEDTYDNVNPSDNETSWHGFYDSHIDFWYNESTDLVSMDGKESADFTYYALKSLTYNPQVSQNRLKDEFMSEVFDDEIYWYDGHGGITTAIIKENAFSINAYGGGISTIYLDRLDGSVNTKFMYISACFSGDNSTTLTGCTLDNWLSNASVEKGVDCYLGFLGDDEITNCPDCDCQGDVGTPPTKEFNTCFWNYILEGETIEDARDYAEDNDMCPKTGNYKLNSVLVNSTPEGCKISLVKE